MDLPNLNHKHLCFSPRAGSHHLAVDTRYPNAGVFHRFKPCPERQYVGLNGSLFTAARYVCKLRRAHSRLHPRLYRRGQLIRLV